MVKLLVPVLFESRLIPKGTVAALPAGLEQKLIDSGNAERASVSDQRESEEHADAVSTEAGSGETTDQPARAPEPAEAGTAGSSPDGLGLGRGGVQVK